MTITITYRLSDPQQEIVNQKVLGTETYQNIDEILIPHQVNANTKTTITRFFAGQNGHRWLVKEIKIESGNVDISLEFKSIHDEIFLTQTIKKTKKSAQQILQSGTIVEVDFGFKPKIVRISSNEIYSAKRYPDVLQQVELYKRRPAIVHKATKDGISVIPLTSKEPKEFKKDSSIFQLSEDSLKDCVTLKNKSSFALTKLIQVVDPSRILPPLSTATSRKAQRLENYRVRLNDADKKKLQSALASYAGVGDYYENKHILSELNRKHDETVSRLADLESECLVSRAQKTKIQSDFEKLKVNYETLFELLKDQYVRAGLCSQENVEMLIKHELEDFKHCVES